MDDKDPLELLFDDFGDEFLQPDEVKENEAIISGESDPFQNLQENGRLPTGFEYFEDTNKNNRGMTRNAKSMMDFGTLPSAKRDMLNVSTVDLFSTEALDSTIQSELEAFDKGSFFHPGSSALSHSKSSVSLFTSQSAMASNEKKMIRPKTTKKKKSAKKVDFEISGKKDSQEEKRQKRLARNRESARQSRRRKKQQLESIEQEVVKLAMDLFTARKQFITEYLAQRRRNKISRLQSINTIKDGAKFHQEVITYENDYGVLDKKSEQIREFHFMHALRLVLPPYCRFFLQIVNSSAHEIGFKKKENNAILSQGDLPSVSTWDRLCKDLTLSAAQREKLKADLKNLYSTTAQSEQRKLQLLVTFIQNLDKSFSLRSKVVQAQIRAICDILEPQQVVNFLLLFEQRLATPSTTTPKNDSFFGFSVENLETLVNENDVGLDYDTQSALDFLKKPDKDVTFEDLQNMLLIANR